jgi:hypothetical protein
LFKKGDIFELVIKSKSGKTTIFKGKLYITDQEDLENFSLNYKINNKIKI